MVVESEQISFLGGRRRMVIPATALDRIRRELATIQRGGLTPSAMRSTIDVGFYVASGQPIVVQLCPIPINNEPLQCFRPFELGTVAQTIYLKVRGSRFEDHAEM